MEIKVQKRVVSDSIRWLNMVLIIDRIQCRNIAMLSLSVTFDFYGDVTKILIGNRSPFLCVASPHEFQT